MTNEEAKRILNPDEDGVLRFTVGHRCIETVSTLSDACRVAVKALDKQIPKATYLQGDGYDENGNIILDTYFCPCCGHDYEVDYEHHDYCPACGQAIKWDYENI